MPFSVGDRIKIRGTKETYELGIQHKLGRVKEVSGKEGFFLTIVLDSGRVLKLCQDEVEKPTAADERRYGPRPTKA